MRPKSCATIRAPRGSEPASGSTQSEHIRNLPVDSSDSFCYHPTHGYYATNLYAPPQRVSSIVVLPFAMPDDTRAGAGNAHIPGPGTYRSLAMIDVFLHAVSISFGATIGVCAAGCLIAFVTIQAGSAVNKRARRNAKRRT